MKNFYHSRTDEGEPDPAESWLPGIPGVPAHARVSDLASGAAYGGARPPQSFPEPPAEPDPEMLERMEEAARRIAKSLDLPPEILGMSALAEQFRRDFEEELLVPAHIRELAQKFRERALAGPIQGGVTDPAFGHVIWGSCPCGFVLYELRLALNGPDMTQQGYQCRTCGRFIVTLHKDGRSEITRGGSTVQR